MTHFLTIGHDMRCPAVSCPAGITVSYSEKAFIVERKKFVVVHGESLNAGDFVSSLDGAVSLSAPVFEPSFTHYNRTAGITPKSGRFLQCGVHQFVRFIGCGHGAGTEIHPSQPLPGSLPRSGAVIPSDSSNGRVASLFSQGTAPHFETYCSQDTLTGTGGATYITGTRREVNPHRTVPLFTIHTSCIHKGIFDRHYICTISTRKVVISWNFGYAFAAHPGGCRSVTIEPGRIKCQQNLIRKSYSHGNWIEKHPGPAYKEGD